MKESYNFYRLISIEDACPRKTIFFLKGIEGISQYFQNHQVFLRNELFKFLDEKFGLELNIDSMQKIDEAFQSKFEQEGVGELINNFEALIDENEIDMTEVNKHISYIPDGFSVDMFLDGLGSFQGNLSLFKFNLTTRFNRHDALELVAGEDSLRDADKAVQRLIDLKLGSGDYREVLKDGDRTKKGTLSARGLAPWEDLKKETDETLKSGYVLLEKMKKDPDSYNIPMFGPCSTCPYHNIEIEYDGKKITCTG